MSDFLSFMDLAIKPNAPTGIFNLASGEAHSIQEIFDLVSEYLGQGKQDVPVVPPAADDVPVVSLDASETLRAFGWKAKVSFAETIQRQLAWYDAHGVTDVFSHLKAPETKH
jgi:UDP-glucose 4-epimerase